MFPDESQPRDTYLLWHLFNYPTAGGHKVAFAVSKNWGDSINSIYSVLLEIMLIQAFQILLLVFVSIGNRSSSDFIHFANKLFYEDEPTAVVLRIVRSLTGGSGGPNPILSLSHGIIRGYEQTTILMVIGLTLLLVPRIIPAFAIHGLLIGTAAPVNPAQIYVPQSAYVYIASDPEIQIPLEALSKPRLLRAVNQVETASADLQAKVSVTAPVVLQDLGGGEKILKIDYNYSITAQDFGLQNFHGLQLNVRGSCRTEYGWYEYAEDTVVPTDVYYIFNDEDINFYASPYYGYQPYPFTQMVTSTTNMNNTYAIMISSMQCESFTIGTDPWYLTNTTGSPSVSARGGLVYNVLRQRPGLSCWQSDEWTYKGQSSTTNDLPNVTGLNFPESLRDVFFAQLGTPTVYNVGVSLGSIALASSTTTQSFTIDANSSSIYDDMQRFVLTSYISTTNLLLDTTLYNKSATYGIDSIVSPADLNQVAQFVVSDQAITTISLAFAIAIPIGTLLLFVAVKSLKYYIKPKVLDGASQVVIQVTEKA